MNDTGLLDQALALALKLSPEERLQLIEQVTASVEYKNEPPSSDKHWGESLLRLLDELGPIEMVHPEIDDPVEWVKQIRKDQEIERGLEWGQDE